MPWRACRVVRFHFPRRESAAEPGDPHAAWRRFSPPPRPPSCNRAPPSRGSLRRTPCCEAASASSATFCRAAWSIWSGTNPPYSKTFQGGLLGTAGGVAIAPGVPNSAIDAAGGREPGSSTRASRAASFPARRHWPIPTPAFRPFRSPRFPTASSTRPTSCSGASRSNIRSAARSTCARSMWARAP